MEYFMMILHYCWKMFMSVSIPITYGGTTYEITLYAILIFSTVVCIGVWLLFSIFD